MKFKIGDIVKFSDFYNKIYPDSKFRIVKPESNCCTVICIAGRGFDKSSKYYFANSDLTLSKGIGNHPLTKIFE